MRDMIDDVVKKIENRKQMEVRQTRKSCINESKLETLIEEVQFTPDLYLARKYIEI